MKTFDKDGLFSVVSGRFLGSVCGERDGTLLFLQSGHILWLCLSIFSHFNQLGCSHGGRESKRVRESKNRTSLGVYVQRPIHSVSVLPFRSASSN